MHFKGKEIKVIIKSSTGLTVLINVLAFNLIDYTIFNLMIKINEGMDE